MKYYSLLLFCTLITTACVFSQTGWDEVEKLEKNQKYAAALKKIEQMLESAQKENSSEEWRALLIRKAALQTALHGYENAVITMQTATWPQDNESKAILHLFYAYTLNTYYNSYRWEINNRSKIISPQEKDVKKWNAQKIFSQIHQNYHSAFQLRDSLSKLKTTDYPKYIKRNGYPSHIRATLRDFLTYSWSQFLSNTNTWEPQQLREKYKIDFAQLLSEEQSQDNVLLEAHPLQQLAYLLQELYSWHSTNDNEESALESRLQLVRHFNNIFVEKKYKEQLLSFLEALLTKYENSPWWAAGTYDYSQILQQQGSLVKAHSVAQKAHKAFPNSLGGKRCLALYKNIEAPAFNVQTMALDKKNARSIKVQYKNMKKLFFRAYRLNLNQLLKRKQYYPGNVYTNDLRKLLDEKKPVSSWNISLENLKDFSYHSHYTIPPISQNGLYAIIASAQENFNTSSNFISGTYIMLSDFALIENQKKNSWEVWVVDGKKGNGISNANVKLYQYNYNTGASLMQERRTSVSGVTVFPLQKSANYFVVAEKENQVSFDPNALYFYSRSENYKTAGAFTYTDRSIYRPLQKIFTKIVTYDGDSNSGVYKSISNEEVSISLLDPNWKEIEIKKVRTNNYGTASTTFTIPQGRILGNYQIRTTVRAKHYYTSVRVEEYKRPTFEVSMDKSEKELALNQKALVKGNARYYFGLPLTTGKVFYRITRLPQYPYWYWWYYDRVPAKEVDEIASGFSVLDGDGQFTIPFTPEADDSLDNKENIHYRFQIDVEVTDEGGETRTTSTNYNIGFVGVTSQINLESNFISLGEQKSVDVKREDLSGTGRSGTGQYRIMRLKQPEKTLLPSELPVTKMPGKKYTKGDLLRPRWENNRTLEQYLFLFEDDIEISSGELKHDASGKGTILLDSMAAGTYRIHYTTKDSFGNEHHSQKEFVVAGAKSRIGIPIFLMAQNAQVKVGETALFFLGSGISNQPLCLEIHQKNRLLQRTWINDASQSQVLEIKVTEQYRGGFSVRLHGVHDYQYYSSVSNILVPWNNKELKLSFHTFRNLLRPGQKETWKVKVEGPDANNVSSEILAYMYDRSLDFFTPHRHPNVGVLYRDKYGAEYTRHNLFQRTFNHVFSRNWYQIPPSPNYSGDIFNVYNSYAIGGPGGRRRGLQLFSGAEGALDSATSTPEPTPDEAPEEAQKEAVAQGGGAVKDETPKVRSNFAETAFFLPHIKTDEQGMAEISFEIPESVTEWNVYLHAITSDLKHMTLQKNTVTRKDLMIRPYVPRFFREGDKATLKAVINNASLQNLSGTAKIEILDAETEKNQNEKFAIEKHTLSWTCKANSSTNVSWDLTAPSSLGSYLFKVVAVSDHLSDGELRPVPILPSRIHLAQSRFVTLKNDDIRIMEIKDLKNADKDSSLIHESLVVNVSGQLIFTVLKALPYLTEYPYECVEQTMNRFVCTSMVTSLYNAYPSIAKMAQEFSKRDSKYDPLNENDANRKMALAETPWLQNDGGKDNLINILNTTIASHHQRISLEKLQKAQLNNGGFPWWSGGPASPYMTLYLLSSFARAREFNVKIPEPIIKKAWTYVGNHFRDYYEKRFLIEDYGYEFITFLNYVLSCYNENSYKHAFSIKLRTQMLDSSFKNWTKHSPYIKAMLSLTLKRANRGTDAIVVLESIMDSAITKKDQGTFWAPEDRGWLWYNDNIESHAFILRTLMEVKPQDQEHLDGLVLWLLLNKKMNQWKSTRATAEVVYSLVTFMKQNNSLAIKEKALVKIGKKAHKFVFEPETYSGSQKQIEVAPENIDPKTMSRIAIAKEGKGYMFASMNWHYSTEKLPPEARGDFLSVKRSYFLRKHQGKEYVLVPFEKNQQVEIGDQVEVHLSIRAKHPMEYVHLRDPRGAGFEPEKNVSSHRWEHGIFWYEEIRDSGANFFFENLPQGEYNFRYRVRANMSGKFRVGPATLQSMYAPEFSAFSSGKIIHVKK